MPAPVINVPLAAARASLGASTPQSASVLLDSSVFYTFDVGRSVSQGYAAGAQKVASVVGQRVYWAMIVPAGIVVSDLVVRYSSDFPVSFRVTDPEQVEAQLTPGRTFPVGSQAKVFQGQGAFAFSGVLSDAFPATDAAEEVFAEVAVPQLPLRGDRFAFTVSDLVAGTTGVKLSVTWVERGA